MRAVVMTRHGGPEALELRDLPAPDPGPGQVRVRVAAAAVNNTDLWTREGAYGTAADPVEQVGWRGVPIDVPRVQGGDACGRIDAVGPGVTDRVGERVVIDPARYGHDGPDATPVAVLGSEFDGAFAEQVVVDADRAHDVTTSPLSDRELAALPIAYGTAMGMLDRADVRAGERVVVTGASGGVGIAAVQLAERLGAEVLAVTTADSAEAVREAGAHHVVDRRAGDPASQVRDLHGSVDAVVDVVGGDGFGGWLEPLVSGGRIVVAGAVAGPVVSLDLRRLYLGQHRIIGSTMHTPAQFARLVALARDGGFAVPIAATFPLERLVDAQAAFADGAHVGKIIVDV